MKSKLTMMLFGVGLTVALSLPVKADATSYPYTGQVVLAGWYDFDAAAAPGTPEPANQFMPGIITSMIETVPSTAGPGFGDISGTYGPDWPVPSGTTQNGRANLLLGNPLSFILENKTGFDLNVDWLLLDAGQLGNAAPSVLNGQYTVTNPLGQVQSSSFVAGISGVSTTYAPIAINLQNWLSPAASTILVLKDQILTFQFSTGDVNTALKIDNVLFSGHMIGVPEPGSMLALGCFLGSGLLIRRNRRNVA